MGGLHTGEIECLARRMLCDVSPNLGFASPRIYLTQVNWLGVFARDELPNLMRVTRPFALVFNTDPHNKPGQHWLAIYGPNNGPIELFDSFGMPPSFYGFTNSFIHSNFSFQSLSSDLCGNYTLYFIYNRSRNISFKEIVSILHSFYVPDSHVKNYIISLQKAYRTLNPCHRTGQCCTSKCTFC